MLILLGYRRAQHRWSSRSTCLLPSPFFTGRIFSSFRESGALGVEIEAFFFIAALALSSWVPESTGSRYPTNRDGSVVEHPLILPASRAQAPPPSRPYAAVCLPVLPGGLTHRELSLQAHYSVMTSWLPETCAAKLRSGTRPDLW